MSVIIEKLKKDLEAQLGNYNELLDTKKAKSTINSRIDEAKEEISKWLDQSKNIGQKTLSNLHDSEEDILSNLDKERKIAYRKSETEHTEFMSKRNPEIVKELFTKIDSFVGVLKRTELLKGQLAELQQQVFGFPNTVKGKAGKALKVTQEINKYIKDKWVGKSFSNVKEEYDFAVKVTEEIKQNYGVKITPYTAVKYAHGWSPKEYNKFYFSVLREISGEQTDKTVKHEEKARKTEKTVMVCVKEEIIKIGDYDFSSRFIRKIRSTVDYCEKQIIDDNQIRNGIVPRIEPSIDIEEAKVSLCVYLRHEGYSAQNMNGGLQIAKGEKLRQEP